MKFHINKAYHLKKFTLILFLLVAMLESSQAQEVQLIQPTSQQLFLGVEQGSQEGLQLSVQEKKRSIPLAFLMSALIPGVGQAYNKQWVKTAFAGGINLTSIFLKVRFERLGEEGERAYQETAHQQWNVIDYATWLSGYSGYSGAPIEFPELILQTDFSRPDLWTAPQRLAIRDFFDTIRSAESRAVHVSTGAAFSHKLPYFGEQQYYELIGKYYQFAPGWEDYNGADDPDEQDEEGTRVNASPKFLQYAKDHAKANKYFRDASRLGAVIIINHFVAAFDAAISAKIHNDKVESGLNVGFDLQGRIVPMASLSYKF